jgi:hypothetical protein
MRSIKTNQDKKTGAELMIVYQKDQSRCWQRSA